MHIMHIRGAISRSSGRSRQTRRINYSYNQTYLHPSTYIRNTTAISRVIIPEHYAHYRFSHKLLFSTTVIIKICRSSCTDLQHHQHNQMRIHRISYDALSVDDHKWSSIRHDDDDVVWWCTMLHDVAWWCGIMDISSYIIVPGPTINYDSEN